MNVAMIAEEAAPALTGTPWIGFVILLVTLLALRNIARVVRGIVPADDARDVAWDFRHVAVVAVVYVLALAVVPPLVPVEHEGLGLLVLSAAATLPPIAAIFGFAWALDPRRFGALGLRAGNSLRATFAGLVGYVVAAPGLFALAHVWIWILGLFGIEAGEQKVIGELRAIEGNQRFVAAFLGVLLMPFFEEVLFRGFLQPVLVRVLKPAAGIMITSAVFATLHGSTASVPIFGLSCLLGFVMLHTQRLCAVWAIHALHNGAQFLILYLLPESLQSAAQPGGLVSYFSR